jgi:hypothetical protein
MESENSTLPDLGKLFTQGDDFDQLPLELQAWKVDRLKMECALFNRRYQKNCGSKGGAPREWADKSLEEIHKRIQKIRRSAEYKKEARSNDKGMHAYRMMVIEILSNSSSSAESERRRKRNPQLWKDDIHCAAKAVKVRVDAYLKRKNGT